MSERSVQDCAAETRAVARTNLFLAASLVSAGVAHPVRIRDLSAGGARVETAIVPEAGTELSLVRGGLSVACQVTWSAEHFCGLGFVSPVSVLEWMTHRLEQVRNPDRPAATNGPVPNAMAARLEAEKVARIGRELGRVSRMIETLCETLASDPAVVARHGVELHNLGLAMQTLAALSETMKASGRDRATTPRPAGSFAAR